MALFLGVGLALGGGDPTLMRPTVRRLHIAASAFRGKNQWVRGWEGKLPSLKLTCSHLKMDGWNTTFLLGFGLFSGDMLVLGRVNCKIVNQWSDILKELQDVGVKLFNHFKWLARLCLINELSYSFLGKQWQTNDSDWSMIRGLPNLPGYLQYFEVNHQLQCWP